MNTMTCTDADWRSDLILSHNGAIKPLLANAVLVLQRADEWQGVLAYDEFALSTVVQKPPPWDRGRSNYWPERPWTEQDDRLATTWLQVHGVPVSTSIVAEAIETAARQRAFHPVREYLNELKWDGEHRVHYFGSRYLGADDSSYVREVCKRFLISAVARITEPGCKADHMLILEGPQGTFKSSAIRALGDPWTTDDLEDLGSRDAAMQLSGRWLVEVAELAAMGKPDVENLKAFLSRSTDRFRPPYGRRVSLFPRQCVFVGTTNSEAYLQDATGGRRFWPVRCGDIKLDGLREDRDQLWAEAVLLYQAGERWWLDTATAELAEREQDERFQHDPWQEAISSFLEGKPDVSIPEVLAWIKDKVDVTSTGQVRAGDIGRWTQVDQNRVARCLRALGWQQYRPAKVDRAATRPSRRYRPGKSARTSNSEHMQQRAVG